jgi:DNA-binding beta-propeller fold protein YncE
MKRKVALITVVLSLAAAAALGAGSSGYHITKKVPIPRTGGWDYVTVDESARRVYIAHATQVEVLDADTLEIVGTIPNTPGVHGVAVVPEFNRGFITVGQTGAVAIFDLKTLKIIGEVKVGEKPDAIVYDPATERIFCMNGHSGNISVITAQDGKVIGTIELGAGPEFSVVDGKGNLWVNIEDTSELVHVDTQAMKVKDRWPLAPCKAPASLGFDAKNRRLFPGCRGRQAAVVDADSGKVITTAPIGDHVDATVYDPETALVLHSTGEGNVAVFHQDSPDKYTFLENVVTNPGSKLWASTTRLIASLFRRIWGVALQFSSLSGSHLPLVDLGRNNRNNRKGSHQALLLRLRRKASP